jgi:pimeloyl-ACP methyl ester carboxylesterase
MMTSVTATESRSARLARWALLAVFCGASGACGDDAAPAGGDAGPPPVPLTSACSDDPAAIYTRPAGLPAFDPSRRGDVVRCGLVRTADAAALNAQASALGYRGPALPSGATVYRIAYRTERVPGAGGAVRESLSSALLLVPSTPRGQGTTVVYGHPTVGLGDDCAPSRRDLFAPKDQWYQALAPLLALVGYGYTVVAPDFAGYGYDEPDSFALADDVAPSMLDATRAVETLVPLAYRGTKVAFAGHSLGGHAALAAYAKSGSYGHRLELVGVAGLAPLWLSPYGFAAITSPLSGFDTTRNAYPIQYAMAYLHSHAEMLDGVGAGRALLAADKQDALEDLLRNACVNDFAAALPGLADKSSELFDPAFVESVGLCGITGTCDTEVTATWARRFQADRPAIPKDGPPVVLWVSAGDGTITPGFGQCAVERLTGDVAGGTTSVAACLDPESVHVDVPVTNIGWVSQWIAARSLGEAEPAACPPLQAPDGGPVRCTTPPPNL